MLGIRSKKSTQRAVVQADPGSLVSPAIPASRKARNSAAGLRIAGNILIVLGILMLIGIGGWYGYSQWSNQQIVDSIGKKFGQTAIEPPMNATPRPTPEQPPPPNLNQGTLADQMRCLVCGQNRRTDDSPPVHIVIPSVKIDSKVVPVSWKMIPSGAGGAKSEWQVADFAVGHHAGTANPGQPGNVVLSGHVDYKGQVFRELHNVNKGDEVILQTEKGQYLYVVTDLVLVKEEGVPIEQKRSNARYMDPTPDPTLTMITCFPYGIDDHRLIVIAKPYQSPVSGQAEFSIR